MTYQNHFFTTVVITMLNLFYDIYKTIKSIRSSKGIGPVSVRSKAWVCGRSLTRIVGSNPTGGMDVCLL
jgi:hypothetical protein